MLWLLAMFLGNSCPRKPGSWFSGGCPNVAGAAPLHGEEGIRACGMAESTGPLVEKRSGATGASSPNDSVAARKVRLRREMMARRARFPRSKAAEFSRKICVQILEMAEVRRAASVALYAALPGEVDLETAIKEWEREHKEMLLPRRRIGGGYEMAAIHDFENETVPGAFGILEPRPELPPAAPSALASSQIPWLVPGVAFDEAGARLGRGKGVYDRLLAGAGGFRIGLAFEWQVVPNLPSAGHDIRMDALITEQRVRRFSP